MNHADFLLKSGAKLHVSTAPFHLVMELWTAVRMASFGKAAEDAGHYILASATVQKAVEELYPWATYSDVKMYPGIFDEVNNGERVRADYLEIMENIIEFHLRPFFFTTSSKSTDSTTAPIASRK